MKKRIIFYLVFLFTFSVYALPGFTPFFQDESGEFVYYRDYSFDRESYVGFLNYDDISYELRYYAPFDMEKQLPAKDVSILVSLNPGADFVDMTGERILSSVTPEDAEYVNYLHDLLYEFTARRSKEIDVSPYTDGYKSDKGFWNNGLKVYQDFPQFGGEVSITYDFYIPLFNIKKIQNNRGENVLVVATTGRILSSGDSTFSDFKGFNGGLAVSTKTSKKSDAKSSLKLKLFPKKQEIRYSQRKLTLDNNWSASAENMWWLSDKAYITISNLPKSEMRTEIYLHYLSRRLIQSSKNTYIDFSKLETGEKNGLITLETVIYDPSTKQNMISKKFISTTSETDYLDYMVFSVYESEYTAHARYFNGILRTIE